MYDSRNSWPLLRIVFACAIFSAALGAGHRANALTCSVAKHAAPTDADNAMLAGDFDKAAGLYKAALTAHPGDADAQLGLIHALLRQQKIEEATAVLKDATQAAPKSAALITARGEIEFARGDLWLVEPTVVESAKIDPCNARTRLLFARILEATSRFATAKQQITLAHEFDPADPEIRLAWIRTLPIPQRITELDSYLSAPSGNDAIATAVLHAEIDRLKQVKDEPAHECKLVSASPSAKIPIIRLMGYNTRTRAYGLEVGLNGSPTRLQIDTRGAGITVFKPAADRANVKKTGIEAKPSPATMGKSTYVAVADSVKIGDLEFKNCAVNVVDSASPFDDGVGFIGLDVFSDFLVTADFPMRTIETAPLPAKPGAPSETPALSTIAADYNPLAPSAGAPADRYLAPELKDYSQIYRAGHDLLLPTSLAPGNIKLFVPDEAQEGLTITREAAAAVTKVHEQPNLEFGGGKTFVAEDLTLNFVHVEQKLAAIVTDTSIASKIAGTTISGFIGSRTLNLLTLHLDYRDGLLKSDFVPGRGYKFDGNVISR
ncbi:MAG TPA: tetratricopeptide repeat protein [Terracidiphilus sp.]|nr:tetratricopeptide repeat protein [Terracidiphilus sp.]HKF49352.1 tetratricopeptide repeat protein [Terracidiphilus sp.]